VLAAEKKEEKLSRKERKAREKAAAAEAAAEQARAAAAEAEKLREQARAQAPQPPPEISGAGVLSPGVGSETDPAVVASAYQPPVPPEPKAAEGPLDRPEVVAGIAFVGAFLAARIFKRLVD
jgi:hypothetical protein